MGQRWIKKLLQEKRAEAFFGFYARLLFQIKLLRNKLDERKCLRISNNGNGSNYSGNIFSLLYDDNLFKTICPSYRAPDKAFLDSLKSVSSKLKQTISDTNCNVYPKNAESKKWYESLFNLFSFCDYLENIEKLSKSYGVVPDDEDKPLHIRKCEELICSLDYIQQTLENIKY